ncbi:BTB/POZ domain-containing protein kctd8 [Rhizophlyctis rosea]|nr:BTB/POZ domain-containing protein kctd8 [Rhizophlyctis rosea]
MREAAGQGAKPPEENKQKFEAPTRQSEISHEWKQRLMEEVSKQKRLLYAKERELVTQKVMWRKEIKLEWKRDFLKAKLGWVKQFEDEKREFLKKAGEQKERLMNEVKEEKRRLATEVDTQKRVISELSESKKSLEDKEKKFEEKQSKWKEEIEGQRQVMKDALKSRKILEERTKAFETKKEEQQAEFEDTKRRWEEDFESRMKKRAGRFEAARRVLEMEFETRMQEREAEFEDKKRKWDAAFAGQEAATQTVEDQSSRQSCPPAKLRKQESHQVKLNIGGKRFTISRKTLLRQKDTLLHTLLTSHNPSSTTSDRIFIDRDGTYYDYIFNFLRDGDGAIFPTEPYKRQRLLKAAEYLGIDALKQKLRVGEGTTSTKKPMDAAQIKLRRTLAPFGIL